jgi:hypothetical protein
MNYLLPADTQEVNLFTEVVIKGVLKGRIIKDVLEKRTLLKDVIEERTLLKKDIL